MQQIRIVKKYVTTDGMEFLSLDTATEHQIKIEALGDSLRVGDNVKFFVKSAGCSVFVDEGVVESINAPLIGIKGEHNFGYYYMPDTVIVSNTKG